MALTTGCVAGDLELSGFVEGTSVGDAVDMPDAKLSSTLPDVSTSSTTTSRCVSTLYHETWETSFYSTGFATRPSSLRRLDRLVADFKILFLICTTVLPIRSRAWNAATA